MWYSIGRRSYNNAQIAKLLEHALFAASANPLPRAAGANLVSLKDFHCNAAKCFSTRGLLRADRPPLSGSVAPTRGSPQRQENRRGRQLTSLLLPKDEKELQARIAKLSDPRHAQDLVHQVVATILDWKQRNPRPALSLLTLQQFLSALRVGKMSRSFDAHQFVQDVQEDFGIKPTLELYNSIINLAVFKREPTAQITHLLIDMESRGISPDWESYVAAVSCCTVAQDARGASRFISKAEKQGLKRSELTEAQMARLEGALYSLAIAASKDGENRLSVHFLKSSVTFGRAPSLLALQEALQSAVENGDPIAAWDLLELLQSTANEKGEQLILEEGQWLSLLNLAAATENKRLAVTSWRYLQSSLEASSQRHGVVRKPLPACYYAYIHALAHARQLKSAFEAAAEFQGAHPSASASWYDGFSCLVDGISSSAAFVDNAKKVLEESIMQGYVVTSAMSDCVIAAAGQVGDPNRAFHLFDSFAEIRIGPTTDTYSAVLWACISNGMFDSMPMILKEYEESNLQPNKQLWTMLVWFYIASRSPEGILKALDDMVAEGHSPGFRLLDAAIARLERLGHEEGLRKLVPLMGENNFRNRAATRKVQPARLLGGIEKLTNSKLWIPRQKIQAEVWPRRKAAAQGEMIA